jgi:hypothetical protein
LPEELASVGANEGELEHEIIGVQAWRENGLNPGDQTIEEPTPVLVKINDEDRVALDIP